MTVLDPDILDLLRGPDRASPADRAAILCALTDGTAPDVVLAWASLDPGERPALEAWVALHSDAPVPPEAAWQHPEAAP